MLRLFFCCTTLFTLATAVHAGPACSLRSLKGDYQAQLLNTTLHPSQLRLSSAKGRLSFDGNGVVVFDLAQRGLVKFSDGSIEVTGDSPVTGDGTYNVAADCTGQITPPGSPPGSAADIVIVQRGRMFLFSDPAAANNLRSGFGVEE